MFFRLVCVIAGVVNWSIKKPSVCFTDNTFSWPEQETPTEVSVRLEIHDIYDINEANMHFGMQVKLFLLWRDPIVDLKGLNVTKAETIPDDVVKCIWKPDVTFYISKKSELYSDTLPHSVFKLMKGNLFYHYARYLLLVSCKMKFHNYPMDVQRCNLTLEFLYSRSGEAELVWMHQSKETHARRFKGIKLMDNVQLSQFSLKPPNLYSENRRFKSGNSTTLICSFEFTRYITSSLINTYIPSFLVVCLSFVSFWLDVDAVPGRVSLGVTALLTLATQIDSARNALPSVNYMTALDIWLFGCLLLVFLSLLEFVIANSSSRSAKKHQPMFAMKCTLTDAWKENTINNNNILKENLETEKRRPRLSKNFEKITWDKYAQLIFPIIFITFIFCYCMYYFVK